MGDLSQVDPVGLSRAWLLQDADLGAALGATSPEDFVRRLGPYNEPPYPRLVLTDPPGDDRYLDYLVAPVMQIEVLGDFDGTVTKATLRTILYRHVLPRLRAMSQQEFGPKDPVITNVGSTGGGGWSPLPGDQPRYLATVQIHGHPARA